MKWLIEHYFYPRNNGGLTRKDPTYGRVDRSVQWLVQNRYRPTNVAMRVVLENNVQQIRDNKKGKP